MTPPTPPGPVDDPAAPRAPFVEPELCPRCGTPSEPGQEYCLECGLRLPGAGGFVGLLSTAWRRRLPWYPGDWIWPVLIGLVVAIVAGAVVIAFGKSSRANVVVATQPSSPPLPPTTTIVAPTTTATPTLATTAALPTAPGMPKGPPPIASWPATRSGYTVVLESIPLSAGRAAAVAKARQAQRAGLPDVGVLNSAQFSSLLPGYYVLFSGVFSSLADAQGAISTARTNGYGSAYARQITS